MARASQRRSLVARTSSLVVLLIVLLGTLALQNILSRRWLDPGIPITGNNEETFVKNMIVPDDSRIQVALPHQNLILPPSINDTEISLDDGDPMHKLPQLKDLPLDPFVLSHNASEFAIPNYIHQVWWQSPFLSELSQPYRAWCATWRALNPSFTHLIWNGTISDRFIKATFTKRVHDAWRRLPLMVQRTDFLRYALLYAHGGVYSDLDTECLKPVTDWGFSEWNGAGVFVGKEWNAHRFHSNPQFANMSIGSWTMVAVPRHELLARTLSTLVEKIESASNDTLHSLEHVVPLCGPTHFTDNLKEYLGGLEVVGNPDDGGDVRQKDVVVFEVTRFSPNGPQGKGSVSGRAFLLHHFTNIHPGGWRSKKPNVHYAD